MADAVAAEGCEGVKEGRRQLEGRLDDLMRVVRLSYLVKREGGWNSVADWGETLSLGEQLTAVCTAGILVMFAGLAWQDTLGGQLRVRMPTLANHPCPLKE